MKGVGPRFSPSKEIESMLAMAYPAICTPLRDGYEAGLAATADRLMLLPLRFSVNASAMPALEAAVRALLALHETYGSVVRGGRRRVTLTPSANGRNPVAKIRAEQRRLGALAASVARMDAAMRTLEAHGLALVVATRAEDMVSFSADVSEAFETVAEVSIRHIASKNL
jgi:hypothetical protein